MCFVRQQLYKREYTLGDGAAGALLEGFATLVGRPGWAKARHAVGILEDLPAAVRERAHDAGADMDGCVTYEDVQGVLMQGCCLPPVLGQVLKQLPEAGGARPHFHPAMLDMHGGGGGGGGDGGELQYAAGAAAPPPPPAQATRETTAQTQRDGGEDGGAAAGVGG